MLPKLLLTSFLVLSLMGCGHKGPRVSVCLVRGIPISGTDGQQLPMGCDCYDERTGKSFFLTLEQCDKYVAFPPADLQALITACGFK